MKRNALFFLAAPLVALILPGSVGRAQEPPPAALSSPDAPDALASIPADYRLDIGDTVRVDVLRHADVNGNVLIPADGMVRLPRLGAPVSARGKTCAELADALADGWKHDFVLRPGAVSVSVAAPRQRRIYVRGNAGKNVEMDLKPGWRVSELIASIGGVPQPDRVTARIVNARRPDPVAVNLDKALGQPGSPENVPLLEGDTLLLEVPRTLRLLVAGEGPRGQHEVDVRYGLRRALTQLAYSTNNATGSLREAEIIRKSDPNDLDSPEKIIPVDLVQLMNNDGPEIALRDMDLLYIPPTERYVYVFGEAGGSRKQLMPEDRKTYLIDVIGAGGGTTGNAKIGEIAILRGEGNDRKEIKVDFGRYFRDRDPKNNPEILPQDIVYVPKAKRFDPGTIFTGVGLYNILRTFVGF